MEERLKTWIKTLSAWAEDAEGGRVSPEETAERTKEALVQIGFLQHERLIHLIVTVTFAILTFLAVIGTVLSGQLSLLLLVLLLLVLLIPYIRHYYILENGVQKLYTLYDRIRKAC